MKKILFLLPALALLVAPTAGAQIGDFGQFIVGTLSDDYHPVHIANPTGREMYALMIRYDHDGSLDTEAGWDDGDTENGGCEGAVVPPHGFVKELVFDGADYKTLYEMITVPTDTGEYDRTGRGDLGLIVRSMKNQQGRAISPGFFRLPIGADRTALIACICDELELDGQPDDLFSELGISCGVRQTVDPVGVVLRTATWATP